ncbi:hypothetical protein GINT2_000615 [Glugoides intestinalis]
MELEEKRNEGNIAIKEACIKLKLPTFTKAVSQAIFNKCFDPVINLRRLYFTCILLGAKVTDVRLNVPMFKAMTTVDTELELELAEKLGFKFDVFDVFSFTQTVVEQLYKNEKLSLKESVMKEKGNLLEKVFSKKMITEFAPFGTKFLLPSLCLAIFNDNQIALFAAYNCIEVDKREISEIRKNLESLEDSEQR